MNAPQDSSELPTAAQTLSSLAEVDIETAELFLEQTLAHFPSDASRRGKSELSGLKAEARVCQKFVGEVPKEYNKKS